jgi:hypothetical protein
MAVRTKAAIAIQAFVKAMRSRTRFLAMRRAAVLIQAIVRGKFLFFFFFPPFLSFFSSY